MDCKKLLSGVFAPIVTPFEENESVCVPRLIENIEAYNNTALSGYMPLGSNGEFQGLSAKESLEILRAVCLTRAPGKTIVAGCGRESAHKTIEVVKKAADCGLDMAFILPPHYFVDRMTDDALFAYYCAVADASPIPIVVYNAPKFASGLTISTSLMRRLACHDNVVAMKNSSLQPNTDYFAAIPEHSGFSLVAGNIKTFYSGLCAGAVGGVLSTASYLPEYCCSLYRHFVLGEFAEAQRLDKFLNTLSSATIGRFGVAGVKLGLDLRGMQGGRVRLPLLPIPEEERRYIAGYLAAAGIRPLVS